MAAPTPLKKDPESEAESDRPQSKEQSMPAEASSAASSEGTPGTPDGSPNPKENSKKRAAVDLCEIYGATPGSSKNKVAMKELIAERKKIQKEQAQASKRIRLESQRQKRLVDKASKLNNEDLLEIFRQRHENQAKVQAKAKAKVKAKAKAAGTPA